MIPERQSIDIRMAIHGYTNDNPWIYERQSMDIRMVIYRYTNGNP